MKLSDRFRNVVVLDSMVEPIVVNDNCDIKMEPIMTPYILETENVKTLGDDE